MFISKETDQEVVRQKLRESRLRGAVFSSKSLPTNMTEADLELSAARMKAWRPSSHMESLVEPDPTVTDPSDLRWRPKITYVNANSKQLRLRAASRRGAVLTAGEDISKQTQVLWQQT